VLNQILDERNVIYKNSFAAFEKVLQTVRRGIDQQKRIDQTERDLVPVLMALGKAALEDTVTAAGDGDLGETLETENQTLKRSPEKRKRHYRSIFGLLEIPRYVYQIREKTKYLRAPLDEKLGLPGDEVSYVLEDWLTNLSVNMPYDSAAEYLQKTLGINASSSTAENRVRKLGESVESFYEERKPVPAQDEKEILVCLGDAKGVPIRRSLEQRLEEELGIKPHKRQHKNDYQKSTRRSAVGDKTVRTQRGTIGACYSIERHHRSVEEMLQSEREKKTGVDRGPKPRNKRLWAEMTWIGEDEVSRGAERVFASLADEVEQRNSDGNKPLVCVMDGDRSLWKLQQEYLPQAVCIVDLYHVMEKLWKAAHCFHRDSSLEAESFVSRYLRMLLEGKVDSVRGVFQRFLNQKALTKTKQTNLQEVITYFRTNRDRMRYNEYLAAGYPIGSGVVEGGCKHVIGDRFCGSGMRWEIEGAQPLLDLRVTHLNDEWDSFIEHHIHTEQKHLYQQAA
jgi:hypothetical protein